MKMSQRREPNGHKVDLRRSQAPWPSTQRDPVFHFGGSGDSTKPQVGKIVPNVDPASWMGALQVPYLR